MGVIKRGVKSGQRQERRLTFLIDADASSPSITLGSFQGSLTRNGAGDYTLTLNDPFGRAPVARVSGAEADTAGYSDYASNTVSSVDVQITDLAGLAADNDVLVEVIGWDTEDEA
jgi:hypothetical protein